jgi:hypothetical protein
MKRILLTLNRGLKRILGKNERQLENSIGNAIEIDSNAIKQTKMRMKNGRTAGPRDIPIVAVKVTGNVYHILE